ncbi:MAG TPA: sulfhydrogenase subunit delta [Gammaproteobacteria bacterium]|nr:sulfhydrogenase subunit delta [Gammaproteobacteria bacterium]
MKLAVHKFTSCDGCQLAFLNAGNLLLELSQQAEIVHFVEAGIINPTATVDIAFVEGSVSTPEEIQRIKTIRENTRYLITIGACATAGGIQALRNFANYPDWVANIYASPQYIDSLATSTPIAQHVHVDLELWGCPVNTEQVFSAIKSLLFAAKPRVKRGSVCMECKRLGLVCVLVSQGKPCMGPVTQTGCGALCPGTNRDCYACYGPSENPNPRSLGQWFEQLGFTDGEIAQKFHHINNQSPAFHQAGDYFKGIRIIRE